MHNERLEEAYLEHLSMDYVDHGHRKHQEHQHADSYDECESRF